jgi:hypothetical protein
VCIYILIYIYIYIYIHTHTYIQILGTVITDVYSHYSYRKREIEHLVRLTDSFSWEELPTRDPDTGHSTKAGYIPTIQRLAIYSVAAILVFLGIQSSIRIVLNHDMVFTTWYPFDASASPAFEIANLTQVRFKLKLLNLNLFDPLQQKF